MMFNFVHCLIKWFLTHHYEKGKESGLTEGLAESVVGAEGAPRAFILKLGYFGSIL